jgi:hypothetical protein
MFRIPRQCAVFVCGQTPPAEQLILDSQLINWWEA